MLAILYPFGPGPWISIWLGGLFRVLSPCLGSAARMIAREASGEQLRHFFLGKDGMAPT